MDQNNDEVSKFWKEREEAHGGTVKFQSYAALIGEAGSGELNGRGGLCYLIGDRVFFEDFERKNALMAMFNRKDKDYEKTEISFELKDVERIVKVSEKWGKGVIFDGSLENHIDELSGIRAIFSRGLSLVQLKGRPSLVMEIMNLEEMLKLLPSS